jgi:hypothetical protein
LVGPVSLFGLAVLFSSKKTRLEAGGKYPLEKLVPILVDESLSPYCTLFRYYKVDCERSMQERIDLAIRHADYPVFDKYWAVDEQVGSQLGFCVI